MNKPELTNLLADGFGVIFDSSYDNFTKKSKKSDWLFDMAEALMGQDMDEAAWTTFLDAIMSSLRPKEATNESINLIEELLGRGADPLHNTAGLLTKETSHLNNATTFKMAGGLPLTTFTREGGDTQISPLAKALETENENLTVLFARRIKSVEKKTNPQGKPRIDRFVTTTGDPFVCLLTELFNNDALSERAFEEFLNIGIDVNLQGPSGNTPLHLATNKTAVHLLLEYGAKARVKNSNNEYPWDVWGSLDSGAGVAASKEMKSEIRQFFKATGASSKILQSNSKSELFKVAYSGSKTGLSKSKSKIISARKKVEGFDDELNLLEMAVLGFLEDSNQHPASAFNHIVDTDESGELWTDRAYAMVIAALMSNSMIGNRVAVISKSKRKAMQKATVNTLARCELKGLIARYTKEDYTNEALPAISPGDTPNWYEIAALLHDSEERGHDYHLCFSPMMWDTFRDTLHDISKHNILARIDGAPETNTRAETWHGPFGSVLNSIIQRFPRDGYPSVYDLTRKNCALTQSLAPEISPGAETHRLLRELPTTIFSDKEERALLAASGNRSEKLIYAILGECHADSAGILNDKKSTEDFESFLRDGMKAIAREPSGMNTIKSILLEAHNVETWLGKHNLRERARGKTGWPLKRIEMNMLAQQKIKERATLFIETTERAKLVNKTRAPGSRPRNRKAGHL